MRVDWCEHRNTSTSSNKGKVKSMAFRVIPHQPIDEELRRVLKEEMTSAAEQLRLSAKGNGDKAIHEARKSVKKIRAVLRLLEGELGGVYDEKSIAFRQIGRTLSELRDAGAMVETFDGLRKRYANQVDGRVWTALRRILLRRKRETEKTVDTETVFRSFPDDLETMATQVDGWLQSRDTGFGMFAPGFEKAFRRGRRAMQKARKRPTPENFHEWRKRIKDHWYHVRLLTRVWGEMMEAYGGVLNDMQTWLGDDHNLFVLEQIVAGEEGVQDLLSVMKRHQEQLREQTFIAGARVYQTKPKQLGRIVKFLWNAPLEKAEVIGEL